MIPVQKLLPPLTAKDREAFNALVADYKRGKANIAAHDDNARKNRKRELRERMRTASPTELLSIGAELQTLSEAFRSARRAAKVQLKMLNARYCDLFPRLLDRADAHADKLIATATKSYDEHFAAVHATPTGVSPAVAFLHDWKQQLAGKRQGLQIYATEFATPVPPTDILPYAADTDGEGGLL